MVMGCGVFSIFSTHMGLWRMSQGRGSRLQGHVSQTPCLSSSVEFCIPLFFCQFFSLLLFPLLIFTLHCWLQLSSVTPLKPGSLQFLAAMSQPASSFRSTNFFLEDSRITCLSNPLYLAQSFQPFWVSLVILLNLGFCWWMEICLAQSCSRTLRADNAVPEHRCSVSTVFG